MKIWVIAATAAVAFSGSAEAAVTTLQSITGNGANNNTFTYQTTLGPDEGLHIGDRFVIFDFAGYISGSVFATAANVATAVENVSTNAIVLPGQNDDPTIPNLVFTYTGPDFRTTGGPLSPFDLNSFGARSTFSGVSSDAFFAQTTKNNPPGEAGTTSFTVGTVRTPASAIPEPATWAMMVGGFGMMGFAARRRTRPTRVTA